MALQPAELATAVMIGGFARLHPGEVARVLEDQPTEDAAGVLRRMSPLESALVFQRLTPGTAGGVPADLERPAAVWPAADRIDPHVERIHGNLPVEKRWVLQRVRPA